MGGGRGEREDEGPLGSSYCCYCNPKVWSLGCEGVSPPPHPGVLFLSPPPLPPSPLALPRALMYVQYHMDPPSSPPTRFFPGSHYLYCATWTARSPASRILSCTSACCTQRSPGARCTREGGEREEEGRGQLSMCVHSPEPLGIGVVVDPL